MIVFGSGAEYDKSRALCKVKESDFGQSVPKDAYGYSKYCISKEIEKSEHILNLRIFGIYGLWENPTRVTSCIVNDNLNREPMMMNQNVVFDFIYIDDLCDIVAKLIKNFPDKKFLNRKGTDHLKTMGLNFTYSKPKELVMHLLSIVHLPNDALILDFFAGSGTTGEAVLELNQKEKTQRRFILCTNNEENICSEICYPRIKKVITGYIKNEDKETSCFVEGLGGNLLYYKTGFFK